MIGDYTSFKRSAIRYWERRRIVYNVLLIPPALFGYGLAAGISAGVGDRPHLGTGVVALLFLFSAFGANVCYSFGYALEFLFGNDDPESRWRRFWRPLLMVLGTMFAMLLASIGGRNIAWMRYSWPAGHSPNDSAAALQQSVDPSSIFARNVACFVTPVVRG